MLTNEYKENLLKQLESMEGTVAMYYKNLVTGDEFAYNENESLQPASVIKLPVFLRYLQLADEGKISLQDTIHCTDADKVGGCGAVKAFPGEVDFPIETLLKLMIQISDNTATNLIINNIGREEMDASFADMGLKVTHLNRIMFDSVRAAMGIENSISAGEMGMLFEKLYKGEWVSREVSDYALEVLKGQQINHKIPGYIGPYALPYAHKTGEDDGISNDVGIVYAKEPFILCFVSTGTDVPAWERFMRQTALELFNDCGGKAEA